MNVLMCDWAGCRKAYEWKHGSPPEGWIQLMHVEEWRKQKGDIVVGEQSVLLCPDHAKQLQNDVGIAFKDRP